METTIDVGEGITRSMEEKVVRTLAQLHDNHPHSNNNYNPSMEKFFSCFAPTARFLGSEAGENWDMPAYKRYMVPMYNRGGRTASPPFTLVPQEDTRRVSISTPLFATFDEVLLGCNGDGEVTSELRGSGCMMYDKVEDRWRVILYHLSVPVPNDAALTISKGLQQPPPLPS